MRTELYNNKPVCNGVKGSFSHIYPILAICQAMNPELGCSKGQRQACTPASWSLQSPREGSTNQFTSLGRAGDSQQVCSKQMSMCTGEAPSQPALNCSYADTCLLRQTWEAGSGAGSLYTTVSPGVQQGPCKVCQAGARAGRDAEGGTGFRGSSFSASWLLTSSGQVPTFSETEFTLLPWENRRLS